jgi:hypothetical protein
MAHFKAALESGDCAAALWAAAINTRLSEESKRTIFGLVHMAMHWSGEESLKLKRKLAHQQNELIDMEQDLKKAVGQRRSLKKENKRLKQDRTDLEKTLRIVEREKSELEAKLEGLEEYSLMGELELENRILRDEVDVLMGRLKKRESQMASLDKRNICLASELEQQREMERIFRDEAEGMIRELTELSRCDTTCPSFNLCKKRILIVGGKTRMESLYRQLIEGNGGLFEYHDGYMKNGVKQLESSLKRADLVLCPVSCNSHAACSMVKNLAKKHNKTVHMLSNFSMSAVTQVIRG